jgi:hypothetical protein
MGLDFNRGFILFRTMAVGAAIKGWNVFHGGCFQAMDTANQSLNLTPSGHRLPPALSSTF